jgi:transcriptional regulator with XRE-family HTH domain
VTQRATAGTDVRGLSQRVGARRRDQGLSLRDAAAEIGLSFNTLARVERGHLPDLDNLRKIQRWLGELDEAKGRGENARGSTPELIATHLRTDPLLEAEAADRIAAIVRDLYDALAKRPMAAPLHLRAAKTFKPDSANALADILGRMQTKLRTDR